MKKEKEACSVLDHIRVYGTDNWLYLVGTCLSTGLHHVLKALTDGELNEYLRVVASSPDPLKDEGDGSGFSVSLRAFAIAGFIRFVAGWYVVMVVKASEMAELGYDWIMRIDEVVCLYIPFDDSSAKTNSDEQRYLRSFQLVDLTTNCYYSPTYNLSVSLQQNVLDNLQPTRNVRRSPSGDVECRPTRFMGRFVWNRFLLQPLIQQKVDSRWITPIVHGFVGCRQFSCYGLTMAMILISRRSTQFAGTRFLKRGCDSVGNVANEVETEQIIFDESVSDFTLGRYTSFVQLRGSIPIVWSQDQGKAVTKPPIVIDVADPYALYCSRHFADLRSRYGSPILAVNLVKKREKRPQESTLGEAFKTAIAYLNQFLPPEESIIYLSFDMARCNKLSNVISRIEAIGNKIVEETGFFQTFHPHVHLTLGRMEHDENMDEERLVNLSDGTVLVLQKGVARTNCVDCLDRTNAAQLVIAQVLLAHQLHALGIAPEPRPGCEKEMSVALESMYELQGDALAMQYAGSQLVHSVKTYKKSAIFQERSRDVIQTLSRYYSSTFSAGDRQNGLNLFLGVYRPSQMKTPLWDLITDLYLHNGDAPHTLPNDYCAWWAQKGILDMDLKFTIHRPIVDPFDLYYEPWELSSFDAIIPTRMKSLSVLEETEGLYVETGFVGMGSVMKLFRRTPGPGSTLESSLSMADRDLTGSTTSLATAGKSSRKPGFLQSLTEDKKIRKVSSTQSLPQDSDEEEDEHSDIEVTDLNDEVLKGRSDSPVSGWAEIGHRQNAEDEWLSAFPTLSEVCPDTGTLYGFQIKEPSSTDLEIYARYAAMSAATHMVAEGAPSAYATYYRSITRVHEDPFWDRFKPSEDYGKFFGVVPTVKPESMRIYEEAVRVATTGKVEPSANDLAVYENYINSLNFL